MTIDEALNSIAEIVNHPEVIEYADDIYFEQVEDKIVVGHSKEKFNYILTKEYRDYKYKIYLDAERDCLCGEIESLNGWYDAESLTHLKEQIEREIELEVNYKCQKQLAEENSKLKAEVERLKEEKKSGTY